MAKLKETGARVTRLIIQKIGSGYEITVRTNDGQRGTVHGYGCSAVEGEGGKEAALRVLKGLLGDPEPPA